MSRITVIGAGKTGRGFLGRLLAEEKREILFIDKNEQLVEALNRAGHFGVSFFGNRRQAMTVDNFTAATWEQTAVLPDAGELILVSVGGANLAAVGAELKKRLADGAMHHIIVCENASHPAKTLKEAIGLPNITVSESTVFCTTIEEGELNIASENYPYLQCDAAPLGGWNPGLRGLRPVDGFENFLTRKLYTYNAASCLIAYLGYVKGYTDYGAAANDSEILTLLDRNYAATNRVLCRVYGYTEQDQDEFAALSKQKFCDRTIADTVSRNAREPQRKLQGAERIIGPLRLLDQAGEDTAPLVMTAAAALLYTDPADPVWQNIRDTHTPEQILAEICGIAPSEPLAEKILTEYDRLKACRESGRGLL